ncbi:MAG: hypothetical protein U0X39_13235 [Bacteroidales bacterium]
MKKILKQVLILVFILACFHSIEGQYKSTVNIADPAGMLTRLRQNIPAESARVLNDSLVSFFKAYTSSDSVFRHRFNTRLLGQVTSPDSLLKIISWNYIPGQEPGQYVSFVIFRSAKDKIPVVTLLNAEYSKTPPSQQTYHAADWYGCLYYDARPFSLNGVKYYLLLGIDYGNPLVTRKVIDVLDPGSGASMSFGLKCFADQKAVLNRVVFQYGSNVVMSLKFETQTSVVFDHLSPVSPEYSGNWQFYGPDFSFDSFTFENGLWRLKSDIDIRNKQGR